MSDLLQQAKAKLQGSGASKDTNTTSSTSNLPKTFKAAVIESANSNFVLKDLDLHPPTNGEILVKVLACGICGSDEHVVKGHMGSKFPHVAGHEVIGVVAAVPETEDHWKVGDRVGGPWHGGHCGFCTPCKKGNFVCCKNEQINGVTRYGGMAEYVHLRREATVPVPEDVDPAEYAPILCAGITVFNSLRKQKIEHGAVVAVSGLGGLGHLAVQFAAKMGYKVVALSSSASKKEQATKLGAMYYIDQSKQDAVEELQKLGGAGAIICTAGNPEVISPLVGGLAPGGTVLVLAPVGEVPINVQTMILSGTKVAGWPSGSVIDCEEAIDFTTHFGIKCMIEKFPLDKVQEAYDHTTSGKVRFRSVLVMDGSI